MIKICSKYYQCVWKCWSYQIYLC